MPERAPGKRLPQGGRLCPPGGRGPPAGCSTTTLKGADGRLIPVKTSGGVPRDRLLACMETLRHCILPAASLSVGQTALQDPFGLGVDVVVTGSPMEMNYMHNKK